MHKKWINGGWKSLSLFFSSIYSSSMILWLCSSTMINYLKQSPAPEIFNMLIEGIQNFFINNVTDSKFGKPFTMALQNSVNFTLNALEINRKYYFPPEIFEWFSDLFTGRVNKSVLFSTLLEYINITFNPIPVMWFLFGKDLHIDTKLQKQLNSNIFYSFIRLFLKPTPTRLQARNINDLSFWERLVIVFRTIQETVVQFFKQYSSEKSVAEKIPEVSQIPLIFQLLIGSLLSMTIIGIAWWFSVERKALDKDEFSNVLKKLEDLTSIYKELETYEPDFEFIKTKVSDVKLSILIDNKKYDLIYKYFVDYCDEFLNNFKLLNYEPDYYEDDVLYRKLLPEMSKKVLEYKFNLNLILNRKYFKLADSEQSHLNMTVNQAIQSTREQQVVAI
jgi:nitrogen regulatory protein PII-like uncharacterized protein